MFLNGKKVFDDLIMGAKLAANEDIAFKLMFIMKSIARRCPTNTIHYESIKSKHATRSNLAVKLLARLYDFDVCSIMHIGLKDLFKKQLSVNIYASLRRLFDWLTNINSTIKERLLPDLCKLQESCDCRNLLQVL